MKKIISQLLDHSTEIIMGIFILAVILGLGKLLIQRINSFFYKDVVYVYACPQNTQSSKCYKVRADMAEDTSDEFPLWFVQTIYFDNGEHISFNNCNFSDKKYTCYPEKDEDGVWEMQISEVKKVRK